MTLESTGYHRSRRAWAAIRLDRTATVYSRCLVACTINLFPKAERENHKIK